MSPEEKATDEIFGFDSFLGKFFGVETTAIPDGAVQDDSFFDVLILIPLEVASRDSAGNHGYGLLFWCAHIDENYPRILVDVGDIFWSDFLNSGQFLLVAGVHGFDFLQLCLWGFVGGIGGIWCAGGETQQQQNRDTTSVTY